MGVHDRVAMFATAHGFAGSEKLVAGPGGGFVIGSDRDLCMVGVMQEQVRSRCMRA